MELSTNLRRMRRQAGMTQAALAEALGVSDRAVSRWETGAALPDVTHLPKLAMLLQVSVDALLGVDPARMQTQIEQAQAECTALLNNDDPQSAVTMLRTLSTTYPDQPEIMVYLALALLSLRTDKAEHEALALCRASDGRSMKLSTAYGCKQVMARALHRLGKYESAVKLVSDELPAIWVSRELMLAQVADPELACRARRSNVRLLSSLLTSTLRKLAKTADDPVYTDAADHIQQEIDALPI